MSFPEAVTLAELSPPLRDRLQGLLADLGRPISLSCNRHLGCESSHRKGVDLRCSTAQDRHQLLKLAMLHGFERIGIYPGYIHLDIDHRPRPALWVGQRTHAGNNA